MVVSKKPPRPVHYQYDIDDFINKGGKTAQESRADKKLDQDIKFTMRLPKDLADAIRRLLKIRKVKISRTQWMIEALWAQADKEDDKNRENQKEANKYGINIQPRNLSL